MGEPIRDGDWLLIDRDAAAQRMVWICEHDGMTVIRTDHYGAAALRPENAEAEKATHGRRFGDWVRVASVRSASSRRRGSTGRSAKATTATCRDG